MSKGAFLKENREALRSNSLGENASELRKTRYKRNKQRIKRQKWRLIALIMVLFVVLTEMTWWLNSNPLLGKWYMDDVTAYEFGRGGKGAMILPSTEYEFRYTLNDDVLIIDFVSETAKDAEYSIELRGSILILNGGNATTRDVYTLTKEEE